MRKVKKLLLLFSFGISLIGLSSYDGSVIAGGGTWSVSFDSCSFSNGCGMSNSCSTLFDGLPCATAGQVGMCCSAPKQVCTMICLY